MKSPIMDLEEITASIGYNFQPRLLPKLPHSAHGINTSSTRPARQPTPKKEDPVLKMQLLMDRDIVQAAIDETIRASEKTQERSRADFEKCSGPSTTPKPAKAAKKNAFSDMMSSAKQNSSSGKWTNQIVTFKSFTEDFEQVLNGRDIASDWHRQELDWASFITKAIKDYIPTTFYPTSVWPLTYKRRSTHCIS